MIFFKFDYIRSLGVIFAQIIFPYLAASYLQLYVCTDKLIMHIFTLSTGNIYPKPILIDATGGNFNLYKPSDQHVTVLPPDSTSKAISGLF